MEPYMMQGYPPVPKMELISIISQQGTKDNGHYAAITKNKQEWTLYNDATTTQIETSHMHRTQAYILMFRTTSKKLIKTPPGQNLPRAERRHREADPSQIERPPTEQQRGIKIPVNTHDYTPIAMETAGGGDGDRLRGGGDENISPAKMEEGRERPSLLVENSDHPREEPINLFQFISVFLHLSQGQIEELTSLLSELAGTSLTREMTCKWLELDPTLEETPVDSRIKNLIEGLSDDPEDNPESFAPIIELHNARLHQAHLLHKATVHIIQQKWVEGTNLVDIGKFLQSWAPGPYRNQSMPQGMLQALLGLAPNSQMWTPEDLSNCIFRNTEAADSIDVLARELRNLGIATDHTSYNPESPPAAGTELVRTFPRMRTLHESRRDWLSDEEHWLAIPEGAAHRQCLTHVPRHSWKLMVEFFLALKTNIGSWI